MAKKSFVLRGQACFVTWCKSHVRDVKTFERMLRSAMPAGTLMFGCKEYHEDGVPHYHACLGFPNAVYWGDALGRLRLFLDSGEVDTRSVRIRVPQKGQKLEDFLGFTQRYCGKNENEDLFGERFGTAELDPARRRLISPRCGGCGVSCAQGTDVRCAPCVARKEDKVRVALVELRERVVALESLLTERACTEALGPMGHALGR